MSNYRPSAPFSTALVLLIPEAYSQGIGVWRKEYPDIANGEKFFGSFRTFGGTETTVNGIYAIEDTATVECWYRPDITSGCRIAIAGTDRVYEIVGDPENIEMRNQYLRFNVRRVKGGT